MVRATVRYPAAGSGARETTFRGYHQLVRIRIQRLADQSLTDLGSVGIRGVDEIDAKLQGAPQHPLAFLAIRRFTPDALAGEAHGPESKPFNGQVTSEVDRSGERGVECRCPLCHSILPGRAPSDCRPKLIPDPAYVFGYDADD